MALSQPRAGINYNLVHVLRFGLADANSGIDPATLSVTADIALAGRAAGAELADLAVEVDQGIYEIALSPPIAGVTDAHLYVEVRDQQGNVTRVARAFDVLATEGSVFRDGFEFLFR